MCLSKVDKEIKQYKRKTGYKVYRGINRRFPICSGSSQYHPVGEWNIDPNSFPLCGGDNAPYPTGYHIFISKGDALKWALSNEKVSRVKFDEVVATGLQNIDLLLTKVVVARKFKFLE